jgi:hypothetical protein
MKKIESKIKNITFLITNKIEFNFLVVIFIFLASNFSYAQGITINTATSGTYTVPLGVTSLNVQVWGAGGAGEGRTANGTGSGGGGGGYTTKTFNVIEGDAILYTLAASVLGGTGSGQTPASSTVSHLPSGTILIANGGKGGGSVTAGIGGSGGTATGGDTNVQGLNGGNGGGANSGAGGAGANGVGLGGASQTANNSAGKPGGAPGGGGSGAKKTSGTANYNGGNGGIGRIIITCNPTITALSATSGCVGSTLTITGTSLSNLTSVTIGGTPVTSITSSSDTQIVAVVGSGTTGTVSVTTIAGTATSAATFTINPLPTSPVIVSPTIATSICNGSGTSINLNATSAGNTIYWYTVASGGTSIGNTASGVNLTVTPTATTTYYAEARNTSGCVSSRVATATLTFVNLAVPTVEFTQGQHDTTYTLTNMCGTISGGGQNDLDIDTGNPGGSATYQWQVSYDNGVNWVNGPGPTSTTTQYVLDPAYTIYETVAGVYKFRIRITNLGCTVTSSAITLTTIIGSNLTPGAVAGTQAFCALSANPVAFTQTTAPTGGNGTFTYQWQSSTDNVNFTSISGATSVTYDPPTILQTTYYRRVVITGGCSAYSNTLTVYIGAPTISVTAPTSVCSNSLAQTTTLPFTVTGTPVTYSITWSASPTNSFAAVSNASLPASPITINIPAGTVAGTYSGNIVVANGGGCISTSVPFSIVVNTSPATPTISTSGSTTFCSGGSVTLTSVAGTTYLWSTGATTQSIVVNTSGSYSVIVTNATGCQSNSSLNTIVSANTTPIAPDVETVTLPTCASVTGAIHFHDLPSGSWTLNQYGSTTSTITGSGNNTTVYNLVPGTYSYTITSNGCVSPSTGNINIIGLTTTTWNGTSWSNGAPNSEKNIIFAGDFSSTGTLTGCSCTINSGAVVINAVDNLVITNDINTVGGSLTFENNSNLIQLNSNATNTGNITYKRNANIKQYDYVYWSSPVSGFVINNLSLTQTPGPKYSWNPTAANGNGGQGNWASAEGSVMSAGKGYIVRAPNSFTASPSIFTASFVGVPNNGTIPVAVSRGTITGAPYNGTNGAQITNSSDNWNLIGNPYPSSIRANQFLLDNQSIIEGSIRLWLHGSSPLNSITSPFYGSYSYNYTPNDYLTYNFTGTSAGPVTSDELFIGAGQGFFIEMLDGPATTTSVSFNNALRSSGYNNSTFYKSSNTATPAAEKDRIWLDIVNSANQSERTLIGYVSGATNDKDNLYDASYNVSNAIAIYSLVVADKMNIQGRALPFNSSDVVPVGVNINSAGNYKIAIGALEGLFNTQNVYVEDLYLNTIHDLKQSPYNFSSAVGTFNDRFVLRYTSSNLSNSTFDVVKTIAFIDNDKLKMQATEPILKIDLYDIAGKLIKVYDTKTSNSSSFESDFEFANGAYIICATLSNGTTFKQKLIK